MKKIKKIFGFLFVSLFFNFYVCALQDDFHGSVSVILPVYNVADYLEECLDSVINQSYKNLEIICVNDGSTDNSLEILKKDKTKDSRIKLIDQKNQGVSSESSLLLSDIDSKTFTNIIMNGKDKDAKIRFLLNNSHLSRHGYLKNHAYISDGEVLSIASCYGGSKGEYLCNVFTPDVHRRKGYAGALIREITNNNKEYHLICVEDVSVLYEKCGFKPYAKWIEFLY